MTLKQFTAAVEDDHKQAVSFATTGETPCFLIQHPWNRSEDPVGGIQWVENWQELTELLLALTVPA